MSDNLEAIASKADKALPGVKINIGGKERVLKYSLYALCMLDEKTGKNPLDGSVFKDLRPKDIISIIWAGLLHEEPDLDFTKLAQSIDLQELREVSSAMTKAFVQASPNSEEDKKKSSEAEELPKAEE